MKMQLCRYSPPCGFCTDRHPLCHSHCTLYEEYRAKIDEMNESKYTYNEQISRLYNIGK